MMKKNSTTIFLSVILILSMSLAMCGCGASAPSEPVEAEDGSGIVISTCDTLANAFNVELETNNVHEGSGAWEASVQNTVLDMYFDDTDITDYADGHLSFWIYIEDPMEVGDVSVKLSSQNADSALASGALQWNLKDYISENSGWQQVSLPLYSAELTGEIDTAAVNALYIGDAAYDTTILVDDIEITG